MTPNDVLNWAVGALVVLGVVALVGFVIGRELWLNWHIARMGLSDEEREAAALAYESARRPRLVHVESERVAEIERPLIDLDALEAS